MKWTFVFSFIIAVTASAADIKISELDAITSPSNAAVIPLADANATPKTRKYLLTNLVTQADFIAELASYAPLDSPTFTGTVTMDEMNVSTINSTTWNANDITATNSVKILSATADMAALFGADKTVTNSATVSKTELEYLNGVTSAVQTQLDAKAAKSVVNIYAVSGSPHTWTKPAGAVAVRVICVGGGGGGGSGRVGDAASERYGGGGGAAGNWTEMMIDASLLGSTETVTVGAGGPGGPAAGTAAGNGNAGTAGGNSSFGSWCAASGGGAGGGGTAAAGAAGALGSAGGVFTGTAGGAGSNGAGTASSLSASGTAGTGGGGGGGVNASDTTAIGGAGGVVRGVGAQIAGGTQGSNPGGNGGNGTSRTVGFTYGGSGGGGGGGATAANGGAGGNGGLYGGGGGGGGASLTTRNSGAGGNGADGVVMVITYF